MNSGKVLILGDDTRSFLATVRSLGRKGIAVHAAPGNFRSPALASRYIAAVHEIPPWMDDGTQWLGAMEALLRAQRFDLVIPCNETTLLPLQKFRGRLAPLARLAIPDDHAIAVLFDKNATRELAQEVGVPVATGRLVRPDDTAEALASEFNLPLVIKPRCSYVLETLGSRGKAQVIRDVATLTRVLADREPGETLLEQFFPGQGLGISLLASQGRVLQAFEHHRVRELSGASYYRVSAALTPALLHGCEAIVASVPYTGLAMFEFKRNEQGGWILLEVNARPWGSMPLPVALGVDFPYLWYRLLVANEESPAMDYPEGIYGRNFLPDIMASREEASSLRLGRLAKARFMAGRGLEMLRGVTGRERHDVLVQDDRRPGLIELRALGGDVRRKLAQRLFASRRRAGVRAVMVKALRAAGQRPRIVFVCQGNICRSPFAAALLRARLGPDNPVKVDSAGMIPRPGRLSPGLALEAAGKFGIDLSGHRSAWLTRVKAEQASMLVVFDEVNRTAVLDRYPDLRVPIVRLDALTDGQKIDDPVDGGALDFARCYQRIEHGVAKLVQLVTESGRPIRTA